MDNIKNEINDFLHPANEQVYTRAKTMTDTELKEKYRGGYNSDIVNALMSKNIEIAKKQILDEMKFEQEYKQLRHQGDLKEQQATLDRHQANIRDGQLLNQWILSDQHASTEMGIAKNLDWIDPNAIALHYQSVADYFNVRDTQNLFELLNNNSNNIDFKTLENIIDTPLGKSRLNEIRSIPNIENKSTFVSAISNAMQLLAKQRVDTSLGFMDAAKKDITVRTDGVKQKMGAFDSIRKKSMVNDPIYVTSINELDQAIERINIEREKQRQMDQVIRQQQLGTMGIENYQTEELKNNERRI